MPALTGRSYIVRPDSTLLMQSGWDETGAPTAHAATDDAVTCPTVPGTSDFAIYSNSSNNGNLRMGAQDAPIPEGEFVAKVEIFAYVDNQMNQGDAYFRLRNAALTASYVDIEPPSGVGWTFAGAAVEDGVINPADLIFDLSGFSTSFTPINVHAIYAVLHSARRNPICMVI